LKIIQHYTFVYEKIEILPTVLVIANKKCVGSSENEPHSHLVKIKSDFRVQKCLMFLSNWDITPFNDQSMNTFNALCQLLPHLVKILSFSSDVENQTIKFA
jgi:hypothetical protein